MFADRPPLAPKESMSSILEILRANPEVGLTLVALVLTYLIAVGAGVRLIRTPCLLPILKYELWLMTFLAYLGQIAGVSWLLSHAGPTHALTLHLITEKLYLVLIVYTLYNVSLTWLLVYVSSQLKPNR